MLCSHAARSRFTRATLSPCRGPCPCVAQVQYRLHAFANHFGIDGDLDAGAGSGSALKTPAHHCEAEGTCLVCSLARVFAHMQVTERQTEQTAPPSTAELRRVLCAEAAHSIERFRRDEMEDSWEAHVAMLELMQMAQAPLADGQQAPLVREKRTRRGSDIITLTAVQTPHVHF